MARRRPRGRRSLLLLAGAAALLGATGALPARAQVQGGDDETGDTLFGSYELEARGTGVQASYELVGLLPGGAKVLDLTIPEALARFGSGPVGYGLASLAYPGGLIVNLDSLIAQTGGDGAAVPPYPIKAEAFYPAGPTEAEQVQAGSVQQVRTGNLGVQVVATFPAINANPAVTVGSLSTASRTSIEEGMAVSRTRVALGDITILGGVITIDSLVTDLVAAHDGTTGNASGDTVATGVKFLGLAATLTEDGGLVLDKAPPVTGPGGPLGSILDPVIGPLNDLTAPVRALVDQVLQQAVPSLTGPLAAAGIDIRLLRSDDTASASGAAGRTSSGLSITLSYLGREQAALVDLLNSLPDDLKPGLGPIPNPVTFLAENHITSLTLGTGTVSALASLAVRRGGRPPGRPRGRRPRGLRHGWPPPRVRHRPAGAPAPRHPGRGRQRRPRQRYGAAPPSRRCCSRASSWHRRCSAWPPPDWRTTSSPPRPAPARPGSISPLQHRGNRDAETNHSPVSARRRLVRRDRPRRGHRARRRRRRDGARCRTPGALRRGVRELRVGSVSVVLSERILLVLGGIIAPLGLVVVVLGWWGASQTPYLFEQVPYLISGGLLGVALVFLGSFFYFTHWLTELVKEHRAQSEAIVAALERLQKQVANTD